MSDRRYTYIVRRLTDQVVMSGRLDTMVHLPPVLPKPDIVVVKKYLLRFTVIQQLNDWRKRVSAR